ncbi:MAG: choice-of-anchor D domain-containing protein [Kofleriaceae bacterium]
MRASFGRIFVSTLIGFGVVGGCGDDGNVNMLPDAPLIDSGIDTPPPSPGMLRLMPTSADFGSVVVGQTSSTMTITVGNVGMGPTGTISPAISGSMGSNFEIESHDCSVLQPAATCTVTLSFDPGSVGQKQAMLAVTAAPGGTVMASLAGTGILPGALTITPSTQSFGNIQVGADSALTTLTVRNTGGVISGTLVTTKGGSAPSEFVATTDTCNGQTLAPNATCTLTVRFSPQTSGSKFANFSVTGNPGGTVTTAVNGNGLTGPSLFANPMSRSFGSVVVNTVTNALDFNIVNTGQLPTGALTQALNGANTGDFTVVSSTCAGVTLGALGSCRISVRFNPMSLGTKTAQIDVSAAPGGALTLDLSGIAIASGQLVIEPNAHSYANTVVGSVSAGQTFTVRNTGGSPSGSITTSLGGANPGQFRIGVNNCANVTLAASGTCTITVTFNPSAAGAFTAALLASASPGGTAQAALDGNGTPGAALSISPITKDFGSVGVGGNSPVEVFTITNIGGTQAAAPAVALGGSGSAQFTITDDCSTPLLPTESCTATVRFAPNAIGPHSATVVATASPGGSASASIFGQGANPAALSVNPSSLAFALTTIGDTATPLNFLVTNNGGTPTGTLTVGRSGANPGDFSTTSNCTTLAAGGSCVVTVSFSPTNRGLRTASIVVSGVPGGTVNVGVSGSGRPRLEIISVNFGPPVSPYDVGEGEVLSVDQFVWVFVRLRNNTNQDQLLQAVVDAGLPPQFSINSYDCGINKKFAAHGVSVPTIEAHDTCTANIAYVPTSEGAKIGQITWSIGATAFDTALQVLTSNVVNGLSISAATILPGGVEPTSNFGNIATGETSPQLEFVVSNRSNAPTTGPIVVSTLQTQRFAIVQDNCSTVSLSAGGVCSIWATFSPLALGFDQTLLAVSASPGGPASINISGTGVNPNLLIVNPEPVDFGDVFAGYSRTLTVTVTNPAGAQTSGMINFNLYNDECNAFTVGGGSGSGSNGCYEVIGGTCDYDGGTTILTGGQSCTLIIEFDSTGAQVFCGKSGCNIFGNWQGDISMNASPGTDVTNDNIDLTADILSTISITPTDHDFGTLATETPTQTFTVHNDSPGTVTLNAPNLNVFGNQMALELVQPATCGGSLLSGASCTVNVRANLSSTGSLAGQLFVSTMDGYGQVEAGINGYRSLPISCLAILTGNPTAGNGDYSIDADDDGPAPAILATCDMVSDGGGYTHYFISDGASTFSVNDPNSCQALGMNLVVPRTLAHASSLITNYGATNIIPGVYNPLSGNNYSTCPMNSDNACANDWTAIDGGDWFLNQFSIGQPDGDYVGGCWLGMLGSNAFGFVFNDIENQGMCVYGGPTYVCSTNDKGANIPD